MKQQETTLTRSFGMRECVTITVGSVVGVGLFVSGANVVGLMGNYIILATILALLITIYPSLLYAEMGSALPYAGGTYQYASAGLSKSMGFLAGWNYVIALVSVSSGEAYAFTFYFKTMFAAFGVNIPISDTVIACAVVLIFVILNVRGVEMTGWLANASMFFFWGVAIVWFLMMIPNISLPNFVAKPAFLDVGPGNFISCVAMIWWCFAGFEACCSMGEEIKYPHINIPRALMLTPFIIFSVNAFFQWYLVGIVPPEQISALATAAAPYSEAMMTAGILGIPLALLAAGIAFGGGISTLNSCISTTPRYLFAMARDGMLPQVLTKVSKKYNTPHVATIFLGALTFLLVMTNSMNYIASLSLFADLFTYVIGIAAACGMRKKLPNLKRAYKAPFIKVLAPVSVVIYVVMMTQLDSNAIISGIIWCTIGMAIFMYYRKYRAANGQSEASTELYTDVEMVEPSAEEKTKMDKEFKLWRNVVIVATVASLALYIVPYLAA